MFLYQVIFSIADLGEKVKETDFIQFMKERESFSITWNRIEKKDRELEKCLE